jgi:tetratricopeptide (TPR) repeat protein
VFGLLLINYAAAGPNTRSTNSPAPSISGSTNLTVEQEYQNVLAQDDAAQGEVDKWIRENNAFKANGAGVPDAVLNERIRERFDLVRKAYEEFIIRHPDHAKARIAYGSFLGDLQDELGSQKQWEKALQLDPTNPAVYNNLAGVYSEHGQPTNAFQFFAKAIELNPSEALYYHNFANSLYVLRKSAMGYYHLTEQQVYTKALLTYSNAVRLDPENFPYASDFAQTYYALDPFPANAALRAWNTTLNLAHDELEREGVYVHLARVKMLAGNLPDARQQLTVVTNASYAKLKGNLLRAIDQREHPAPLTNSPPKSAATNQISTH